MVIGLSGVSYQLSGMEGSHHPFFGLYQVSRGRREVSVKGE